LDWLRFSDFKKIKDNIENMKSRGIDFWHLMYGLDGAESGFGVRKKY
jgi:hypothetical protein